MSCCSAQGLYRAGDSVTWNTNSGQVRTGKVVRPYGDYQWCVRPDGSQKEIVKSENDLRLNYGAMKRQPGRPQTPRRPSRDGRWPDRRPDGRRPNRPGRRRRNSDSSPSESSGMRRRRRRQRRRSLDSVDSNASTASVRSRDLSPDEASESEELSSTFGERAGPKKMTEGGEDPGFFG